MSIRQLWSLFRRWNGVFFRHFKSSTPVLLVVGAALLLIGIWWLGPQWTWRDQQPLAPLSVRIALTLILLVIPIVIWGMTMSARYKKLDAERKIEEEIIRDPCLPFIRAQERLLDRNLNHLRENLQRSDYLYKLPWYLVLGQENSGKTSFINRSNQNFTLTSVAKASAGSHHKQDPNLAYPVDFWIGNESVLIDPPGELISQMEFERVPLADGEELITDANGDIEIVSGQKNHRRELPPQTHKRLWLNLVDWLKRNRDRRPLNGIVLMVDITSLLEQSPSDRKTLAILLRARLFELSKELGTRLPLYIVLSKFDLIEGFEEFFARLPRSVRENIFGFTFTLDSVTNFDAWLEELATEYDRFIRRLDDQVFDALSDAGTLEERERLFSLVAQLAGIRPILLSFLNEILGTDRYSTPALVRGLYFSSVYQQGLLNNAFVTAAANSYGVTVPIPEAKRESRSLIYFSQQLFQQVIYPEAGLAGDSVNVLARKRRLLVLHSSVAALACLLMLGGWQYYYGVNRDKALDVMVKSKEFSDYAIDSRIDATGRNLLEPLNQIRDAVAIYEDYREAWPLISDMGLYQGKLIGPKVDEAYLTLLSKRFLPALATGMIDAINAAPPGSNSQLATLRAYRMIEDKENRRAVFVENWMQKKWQESFSAEAEIQHALMQHLEYAMKYTQADLPQYRKLVARVQQLLRQIPLHQRVYMTMKDESQERLRAPLDLRNEIGPAFDIVFEPAEGISENGELEQYLQIASLLTTKGFKEYFEPHSKDMADLAMIDQWVLGERRKIDYSEADKQILAERIRALYTADYVNTWRQGLNAINVTDFNDVSHAVNVLENVSGPATPFRRLLDTLRDNTQIYQPVVAVDGVAKVEAESKLHEDVGRQQAARIERAFSSLTTILQAKGDKPSYYEETQQGIILLYDYMRNVQDSPDRSKAALKAVLDRFSLKGPDPISNLQRMATGMPEPVKLYVIKLADESSKVLMIEALRELEKLWDQEVYSFYSQRLANRYPFNPASPIDASLEDFEAFFGPQGRLQQFTDKYLNLFLKDNLNALYLKSHGTYLVRMDVMKQLEAADRIRDSFFNNRGALNIQFTVEPLGLTANHRSSLLNVDGQLIPYSHGPSNHVGLIWPNTLSEGAESKMVVVNGNGNSSGLSYRGPWSLFRLLSQGHLNASTVDGVDLSFKVGGGAMRYRLTAEKANNPFTQRSFDGFVLPRTLLEDFPALSALNNDSSPQPEIY